MESTIQTEVAAAPLVQLVQAFLVEENKTGSFQFSALTKEMRGVQRTSDARKSFQLLLGYESLMETVSSYYSGDVRKGARKIPFFHHPFSVSCLLADNDFPPATVLAGLLKPVYQGRPSTSGMSFQDISLALSRVLGAGTGISDLGMELAEAGHCFGMNMTVADKRKTWHSRMKKKLKYFQSASPEVSAIEFLSKYENVHYDLQDLRVSGEAHWNRYHGTPGEVISYLWESLVIFQKQFQGDSAFQGLLQNFETLLCEIQLVIQNPPTKN